MIRLIQLIIFVCFLGGLECAGTWQVYKRPTKFDKIQYKTLDPRNNKIKIQIVEHHNHFRRKVKPPAANMLAMKWYEPTAQKAQNWADQCIFAHDDISFRTDRNYGGCGQNIYVSTRHVPWRYAIKQWYLENSMYEYGSYNNSLHDVGHYTQMVWATTHQVGCGFAKCKGFFNYICNYCPSGNVGGDISKPYKRGPWCAGCKGSCRKRLCTNSCPVTDGFSNCREMFQLSSKWTCNKLLDKCKATCKCGRKRIY